jgi:hypothetical protein
LCEASIKWLAANLKQINESIQKYEETEHREQNTSTKNTKHKKILIIVITINQALLERRGN